MKKIINIATGEVKIGDINNILVSTAIGSCIVVTAIDKKQQYGAMAHIMLPGNAPVKETQNKLKYAVNAIESLLQLMQQQGVGRSTLHFCLVGAGNVLKKSNDTICKNNINSVISILNEKQLSISAKALGGILRRSVRFDIENDEVYFTEGDSGEKLLWSSRK